MKERVTTWVNSLTAKYVAVFTLLVAVPAIGISWYLLDSSYNDNKSGLVQKQQEQAKALAGRIDQAIQDIADRLSAIHGGGLTRGQLEDTSGRSSSAPSHRRPPTTSTAGVRSSWPSVRVVTSPAFRQAPSRRRSRTRTSAR